MRWARPGREGPFEAVEDQVEAVLELVAVVVAGLERVLHGVVVPQGRGGKVTPVVDRTYPLRQAPDAVRHLEGSHARGKVVATVPDPAGRPG